MVSHVLRYRAQKSVNHSDIVACGHVHAARLQVFRRAWQGVFIVAGCAPPANACLHCALTGAVALSQKRRQQCPYPMLRMHQSKMQCVLPYQTAGTVAYVQSSALVAQGLQH